MQFKICYKISTSRTLLDCYHGFYSERGTITKAPGLVMIPLQIYGLDFFISFNGESEEREEENVNIRS